MNVMNQLSCTGCFCPIRQNTQFTLFSAYCSTHWNLFYFSWTFWWRWDYIIREPIMWYFHITFQNTRALMFHYATYTLSNTLTWHIMACNIILLHSVHVFSNCWIWYYKAIHLSRMIVWYLFYCTTETLNTNYRKTCNWTSS